MVDGRSGVRGTIVLPPVMEDFTIEHANAQTRLPSVMVTFVPDHILTQGPAILVYVHVSEII